MSQNIASFNAKATPALNRMPRLTKAFCTMPFDINKIPENTPVLIAGPTASGKSELALQIAERGGGVIVNADAMQVFDCWQLLSARPDEAALKRAPHVLYGHVDYRTPYSAGQWLREATSFVCAPPRAIVVGGTGLYFSALLEGLAEIPPTPAHIRELGNSIPLETLSAQLDPQTAQKIDLNNRARVQRAWEVAQATGRSLSSWHAETPKPLLHLDKVCAVVMTSEPDWLAHRIATRFDQMLADGALEEVRAAQKDWDISRPSAKAIGASELMAHLNGEISLTEARNRAVIASRQYAKRQRTWFRSKMRQWTQITAADIHR